MIGTSVLIKSHDNDLYWKKLFPSPYFHLELIHFDNEKKSMFDNYFLTTLEKFEELYPNYPQIILKDTSITHLSSHKIRIILDTILKILETRGWDICYLCDWLEDFHQLKVIAKLGHQQILYQTLHPHGVQSVIISSHGRKKILGYQDLTSKGIELGLNKNIIHQKLKAFTLYPSLFTFNPLCIKRKSDMAKFCFFVNPKPSRELIPTEFFITIVILMMVLLLVLRVFHL